METQTINIHDVAPKMALTFKNVKIGRFIYSILEFSEKERMFLEKRTLKITGKKISNDGTITIFFDYNGEISAKANQTSLTVGNIVFFTSEHERNIEYKDRISKEATKLYRNIISDIKRFKKISRNNPKLEKRVKEIFVEFTKKQEEDS